jgi:DNA-binding CsgD family transcriptional regulator
MDYWESILQEVQHKGDDAFQFKYTDLGRSILRDRTRKRRQHHGSTRESTVASPMYFLGDLFKGVYFTKREAETLFYLLQGKTIPQVGKCLNLSARTIEFYVKNMKLKIGVNTKIELLDKIRKTDIIEQLNFSDRGNEDGG